MSEQDRRDASGRTGITALDRWIAHRAQCPAMLAECRAHYSASGGWNGLERRTPAGPRLIVKG